MLKEQVKFQRYNKYFVLKLADIYTHLDADEQNILLDLADKVERARKADGKPFNHYIVVNQNEPYAEQVWQLIEHGALFPQEQAKQAALKEQMERVIRVIDRRIAEQERVFDLAVRTKTNAKLQVLKALKAELEGEGLVLELGCHYLNSEFECEKGLLINSKCPSECVYYDDGSR